MKYKQLTFKEIRNFAIFGSGQFINLVTPLLVAPYVLSICGVENWGKIGVATSFYIILGIFIDFGSQLIGVKEISSNKNDVANITNYLNETYAFRICIFLLLAFIVTLLLLFVPNIDIQLYGLGSVSLLAQFLNPIWYYIGKENFASINKIIFFSKGLFVLLVYVLVKEKSDYVLVVFFLGIANTFVYSYYFLRIYISNQMSILSVSFTKLLELFRNELPIVISNLSISMYTHFPIIIVKYILGDYYAGIYKIGDLLLSLFRSYLVVFFNVSFPYVCAIFSKSQKEAFVYLKKINLFNGLIISIIIISFYFLFWFVIPLFEIEKKLFDSLLFCTRFLFVTFIIAINIPFYQLLLMNNQQRRIAQISFFGALLMLLSCFYLTKYFTLSGSIYSIYLVESFITISMIIVSWPFLNCTINNESPTSK